MHTTYPPHQAMNNLCLADTHLRHTADYYHIVRTQFQVSRLEFRIILDDSHFVLIHFKLVRRLSSHALFIIVLSATFAHK